MSKFKPGDMVKAKPTETVKTYFGVGDVTLDTVFIILRKLDFAFDYEAYPLGCYVIYRFYENELELCIVDNALNRLLYPELKPNKDGYLE